MRDGVVAGVMDWSHTNILVAGEIKATWRTFRCLPVARCATFEVEVKEGGLTLEI